MCGHELPHNASRIKGHFVGGDPNVLPCSAIERLPDAVQTMIERDRAIGSKKRSRDDLTLDKMFGLGHAAVADAAIADLFYANVLLFYLACSRYWQAALKTVAAAGSEY